MQKYYFYLFLYLLSAIILIVTVLLQKSPGISLQAKSNNSGPRARANGLTKFTGVMAAIFMGMSLLLARMNAQDNKNRVEKLKMKSEEQAKEEKLEKSEKESTKSEQAKAKDANEQEKETIRRKIARAAKRKKGN